MVKWLGVPVLVLAVAQLGRAVSPVSPAPEPALELDGLGPVPDLVHPEDLAAWVLDAYVPPLSPVHRGRPHRRTRSLDPDLRFSDSVANRNNNPLNLKLGLHTRWFVERGLATVSEIVPLDGGRFLKFDSPATGFRAAVELLGSSRYDGLDVERALRLWSNNGFGAEIVADAAVDGQGLVGSLRREELKTLLAAMAAAEGYRSPMIDDEIARALKP